MNVWRRSPLLSKNPYARTAFRVARVQREVVRHSTIVKLIGMTRNMVKADPEAHAIAGLPVSITELNAAEKILTDPRQRILEELLEHATERPKVDQVKQLVREVAEALAVEETGQQGFDQAGLRLWANGFVQQFLDSAHQPDPSFGALETGLIPPFGTPE